MKCPIDQTEMEKGFLQAHGNTWNPGHQNKFTILTKPTWVSAWKCPKCGKIELKAEENK